MGRDAPSSRLHPSVSIGRWLPSLYSKISLLNARRRCSGRVICPRARLGVQSERELRATSSTLFASAACASRARRMLQPAVPARPACAVRLPSERNLSKQFIATARATRVE